MFVQTRYRCPFCRKSYRWRGTAVNHLTVCRSDPAHQTCRTCAHNPGLINPVVYWKPCAAGADPIDQETGAWVVDCDKWVAR